MVNNRNGFTYAANITVLSMALVLTFTLNSNTEVFTILCIAVLCIGSVTTTFYVCKIWEIPLSAKALECEEAYKKSITGETQSRICNGSTEID